MGEEEKKSHETLSFVVKNWAPLVDLKQLQTLQFSVHLTDLLGRVLRCNGFAGRKKAAVVQINSRPQNSGYDIF